MGVETQLPETRLQSPPVAGSNILIEDRGGGAAEVTGVDLDEAVIEQMTQEAQKKTWKALPWLKQLQAEQEAHAAWLDGLLSDGAGRRASNERAAKDRLRAGLRRV